MGTWSKTILSGSTDGEGIKVTGNTPSLGTTIHTAVTGAGTSIDEIYLYAFNSASGLVKELHFAVGPTTATGSRFSESFPSGEFAGLSLVMPGLVLRNAKVVKAFVTADGLVNIFGYVNRFVS